MNEQRQKARSTNSPFQEHTLEVEKTIRTLQVRPVPPDDAKLYFLRLDDLCDSEAKIDYLCGLLRPSLGGLVPLVTFMYHSDEDIQNKVLDIMVKFENHSKLGRRLIRTLNFYFIMTYERLKKTRDAGNMVAGMVGKMHGGGPPPVPAKAKGGVVKAGGIKGGGVKDAVAMFGGGKRQLPKYKT